MPDAPRGGSRADGPVQGAADEQLGSMEQWGIDHNTLGIIELFEFRAKAREVDDLTAELVAALTDAAAHMESLADDDRRLFPADRNALAARAREARTALAKAEVSS